VNIIKVTSKSLNTFISFDRETWNGLEVESEASFIWSKPKSIINLYVPSDILILKFECNAFCGKNITILSNDNKLLKVQELVCGKNNIEISIKGCNYVILCVDGFVPANVMENCLDTRELGVRLYEVILNNNIADTSYVFSMNTISFVDKNITVEKINLHSNATITNVGEYGDVSLNFKSIHKGKINLNNQLGFYTHRSGWNYVLNILSEFHNNNGIIFSGFLEYTFSYPELNKNIIPYKTSWIGVLHIPPNIPPWFIEHGADSIDLFYKNELFLESLKYCKGLYCLSEYYANFVRRVLKNKNIMINVLYHPTDVCNLKFTFKNYVNNTDKKLLHIGWWLRKQYSFFMLNSNIKKVKLLPNNKSINHFKKFLDIECALNNISISPVQMKSVYDELFVSNNEYDTLLSENIVFEDLYNSSANNIVIECIVRNTPILINRLPAVEEYLGKDYPFYFDNYLDAESKLNNIQLIEETYEYLKNYEFKYKLTSEYFKDSFLNGEIYKSL